MLICHLVASCTNLGEQSSGAVDAGMDIGCCANCVLAQSATQGTIAMRRNLRQPHSMLGSCCPLPIGSGAINDCHLGCHEWRRSQMSAGKSSLNTHSRLDSP